MSKTYTDKQGNGKLGKGLTSTDAGIPIRGGDEYSSNFNYYPPADVNYEQFSGTPADGTLLYPEVTSNAVQAPRLSRFRIRGFKDVWASIVFAIFVLFSIVWSIVQLATYRFDPDASGRSPFSSASGPRLMWIVIACLLSAGASVISSSALLIVAQRIPVQMIYVANIITILMFLASAVAAFLRLNVIVGLLMVICTIFQAVWLFLVRDRIPFAAALLRTSAKLISTYKSTFVLNLVLCVVTLGYVVLWGYGVAAPIDRFYKGTANGGYGFVIAVLVFSLMWVSQVMPNVMHVTSSGLVATWYFAGSNNMPRNPTLASFKRAITTSFGSICFGSLVVAIIQFIRWLVESSGSDYENGFLRCLLECMLRCLQSIVEYLNRYAFVHVAIYGCGYIEGAKRTFALCKQCFFAAYFNDCLLAPTLNMFLFAISLLYALIAGVVSRSWPIGVLVFCVAAMVHSLFFVPVDSAVTTVFVCFAECPDALRESDPELYAAIYAADANGTNNNALPPV
ncbi:putative Plasma-membrane choline transporter [Leishmania naiffi]|uniref:Choline transporter-like protein n=1 Tax=Leishmania naiffi TaxID=5678 RepID=A0AAW3B2D8_9TRYP